MNKYILLTKMENRDIFGRILLFDVFLVSYVLQVGGSKLRICFFFILQSEKKLMNRYEWIFFWICLDVRYRFFRFKNIFFKIWSLFFQTSKIRGFRVLWT